MAGKILQVGFADQPGARTNGGEQLDEGDMIARQRNAIVPHAMEPRHRPVIIEARLGMHTGLAT